MKNHDVDHFLASYAGFVGGNLKASIWVCGIEPGGAFEPLDGQLEPVEEPLTWTPEFKQEHSDYHKWRYDQKVAKLMVALRGYGDDSQSLPSLLGWKDYMDELYGSDGDILKINLFPLSAPRTNDPAWEVAYQKCPAFQNKKYYLKRCREVRFPFLRCLRHEHRPKVIVGTGKTCVEDFARAFDFKNETRTQFKINDAEKVLECTQFIDGGTTLIVSPFFGGSKGVNSNGLLIDLAKHIARVSNPGQSL